MTGIFHWNKFEVLALLVFGGIPHALASPLSEHCRQGFAHVAPAQGSFDLDRFAGQFRNLEFKDKEGHAFTFKGITKVDDRYCFELSIAHSKLGEVEDEGASEVFPGLFVDRAGNLAGEDWHVHYAEGHRNRGFIGALFSFFKDRLPNGSRLVLDDISEMSWLLRDHSTVSLERLKVFATQDLLGKKLWESYEKALESQPLPKRDEVRLLQLGKEKVQFEGFKRYIYDLFSIWGRVARKGGYRGFYLRDDRFNLRKAHRVTFEKMEIPKELADMEAQWLSGGIPEPVRHLYPNSR